MMRFLNKFLLTISILVVGVLNSFSQNYVTFSQRFAEFERNEKIVNGYKVYHGERPEIDLNNVPTSAYEEGKLFVKIASNSQKRLPDIEQFAKGDGFVITGIDKLDALNKAYGAKHYKPLLHDLYQVEPGSKSDKDKHNAWGFNLWFEITIDSKSNIKQAIKDYSSIEEIEIAEPIYKKRLIEAVEEQPIDIESIVKSSPNDPQYGVQWGFKNTGQTGGTAGVDIDLEGAWEHERGNINLIVSVHDSGIDFGHPDLAQSMWGSIGPEGTSTVPGDHGTHVAGTIAAVSNNGIGVAGIASGTSGNGVRLMSLNIFGGALSTYNTYVYAADRGAAISQNSWGYQNPGVYNTPDLNGIDYFNANGGGDALDGGGIVIFAAGNDNSSANWYPGYYSGTMAVASHTSTGARSSFSNFGDWVDIIAPGSSIMSTYVKTPASSGYGNMSGTSMACPHVSGVAALVVSKFYGAISKQELWDVLISGVEDTYIYNAAYFGMLGSGRLSAKKALVAAESIIGLPKVSTSPVTNIEQSTATSGGVIIRDGGFPITAKGIVWSKQSKPTLEQNEGFTNDGTSNATFVSQLTSLELNTKYYVSAYATNSEGTSYGKDLSFVTPNLFKFHVVDVNKNPIQGATVTINNETVTTNDQGKAEFMRIYGTYLYKISATNYLETSGNVVVDATDKTIKIILLSSTGNSESVIGEMNVCVGSEVYYGMDNVTNGSWEISGGIIVSPNPKYVLVRWISTSGFGAVRYRVFDNDGYQFTIEKIVSIDASKSVMPGDKPNIHEKGSIPILICTTPDVDYQWFRNGVPVSNEVNQYYAPRGLSGSFQVQIVDNNQCPNTSNPRFVVSYGKVENEVVIYPNPSNGNFTLSLQNEEIGDGVVSISNSYGKIIYQEKISKHDLTFDKSISIPSLSRGIYIIQLRIGNNAPRMSKVSVN